MSKETQGQKLNKNPEIAKEVVGWIIAQPNITDYEIWDRLAKEHNFKCSRPSIASWRKNHYEKVLEDYVKETKGLRIDNKLSEKVDMKMSNLSIINKFIEAFNDRLNALEKILPPYDPEKIEEYNQNVIIVNKSKLELEEQYRDTSKFILELLRERDKIVGAFSPYDVAIDTANKLIQLFTLAFKVDTASDEYVKFEQELVNFDLDLKGRYQLEKK